MQRLAIADDDHLTLMILHDMPVNAGWTVTCANEGSEAPDTLKTRQHDFDPVILDMAMPGLSGQANFLEIRKMYDCLPVLPASGYDGKKHFTRFPG